MDYRTLFLTYLASLTVYAAFAALLAFRNRRTLGLTWFAGSLIVEVVKFTLQGFEGHIPTLLSSLVANELYLVSFVLQALGFRWFVTRTPLQNRWVLWTIAALGALYAVLYSLRLPYIANLINLPVIFILGLTGWVLLSRGRGMFETASRWAALFLFGQMAVSIYRNLLTNLFYAQPWLVAKGQHDGRWLWSLMVMMFFTTCVVLCGFWFFVVELQRELIQQSRTDALTGALNRRALYQEAEREMARARQHGHPLCLLLLDVDDFKRLNDTFGHATGDTVLQRVVMEIAASLRSQDLLARTGGEEFAIILPNTNSEQASLVAERLRAAIEALVVGVDAIPLQVTVSIGVAQLSLSSSDTFDHVLQAADAAMYAAKRSGKNRVISASSLASSAFVLV